MFGALAQYAMASRRNATLVIAPMFAVPILLYWLGAAFLGLVLLRQGPWEALKILVWALLPAAGWAYVGEFRPLIALLGMYLLAMFLHASASLLMSLLLGVLISALLGGLTPWLMPALMQGIDQVLLELMQTEQVATLLEGLEEERVATVLKLFMQGALGALNSALLFVCLLLARWWQSQLYQGRFSEEFFALRVPPAYTGVTLLILLFGASLTVQLALLVPGLLVPLVFSGLALVHATFAARGASLFWIIGFYVMLILFGIYMLVLLLMVAMADSFLNFRRRLG